MGGKNLELEAFKRQLEAMAAPKTKEPPLPGMLVKASKEEEVKGTRASIGLGLSRSSAIAVAELIADDSLDQNGAIEWLLAEDLNQRNIPFIAIQDVEEVLADIERHTRGTGS